MYLQDKKTKTDLGSSNIIPPTLLGGEQETLYPQVDGKQKEQFNIINSKSLGQHQKNSGGYSTPGNALYTKDDAITGGALQKKKKTHDVTQEDREKMRIGRDWDVDLSKNEGSLDNAVIEFQSSMPKQVEKHLKSVVQNLLWENLVGKNKWGLFTEHTTISIGLDGSVFPKLSADDKKKYAGETVFEFTRLKNDGRKPIIHVTELGKNNSAPASATEKSNHSKKFYKYFTLDSAWTDPAELEILYSTINKIPDSILSKVPNLKFKRAATGKDEDGNPDPNTLAEHTLAGSGESDIAVYNSAFKGKQNVRFGDAQSGFSGVLEQAIIHEIGHALDNKKQKIAFQKRSKKYDQWKNVTTIQNEFHAKFGLCLSSDEMYKKVVCEEYDKQEKKTYKEYTDSKTEADNTLDETGQKFNSDVVTDDNTDFRVALRKDGGTPITTYGKKTDSENYAELFALYIVDEKRLSVYRPNVVAYFKKNFPK